MLCMDGRARWAGRVRDGEGMNGCIREWSTGRKGGRDLAGWIFAHAG